MTGVNPGKHGVFGFLRPLAGAGQESAGRGGTPLSHLPDLAGNAHGLDRHRNDDRHDAAFAPADGHGYKNHDR